MKLISIDQACGHTTVVVEKNNVQYYVFVDSYGTTKNEVYENSNFRKIRKNSKLHNDLFSFLEMRTYSYKQRRTIGNHNSINFAIRVNNCLA